MISQPKQIHFYPENTVWSRVSHSKHCTDQPMSTQKPGSHWATEWIMHSSQRCSRNSDTVGRTLVGLSNCSFLIKLQYISKQWDDCTLPCQDYRVKSELKSKAWIYSTSFPLVTRKVIFQWNIINVIIFYSNFFFICLSELFVRQVRLVCLLREFFGWPDKVL